MRSVPGIFVLIAALASIPRATADDASARDLFSDTWVAVDALGRRTPTSAEVGAPRPNKTVGIFYFLWLGRHGEKGPFDITKILREAPDAMSDPANPLWGPMHYPHHWGESIFGYYRSDDDGVLRKHAQMLTDAGVDVVIFDVTNQLTYPKSWRALGRTFDEMRKAGNRVPQMVFLCPFWAPRKVVHELWEQLYEPGLHPELWFQWEGKPLILADPNLLASDDVLLSDNRTTPIPLEEGKPLGRLFTVEQPFNSVGAAAPTWETEGSGATLTLRRGDASGEVVASRSFDRIIDNAWLSLDLDEPAPAGAYYLEMSEPRGRVGWWRGRTEGEYTLRVGSPDETTQRILEFFTFRKPQPDYFQGPTGPRQWSWLEVHPQHAFYDDDGAPEQVSVGVAQNAVDGKLGVLSNPRAHGRSFHDGRQPEPEEWDSTGRNFDEQWKRALEIDPSFVFVTGWNEWIAGRYDETFPLHGAETVTFVDQFDQEYSRDIEPMKGGHGDDFYHQLVANVRRYKGARPIPAVSPRPIQIDGRFDDWAEVSPEYRDTIGDPVRRDFPGWGKTLHYTNKTGRNDLISAKASRDADNLYFLVRCLDDIKTEPDAPGPMLFLDVDGDPKTGWLGYDFVVGRRRGEGGTLLLERNEGVAYQWGSPREVAAAVSGDGLELAIPLSALDLSDDLKSIDFKWADAIAETGDWSDFTLNGDVAPNDRFNYRAIFQGD